MNRRSFFVAAGTAALTGCLSSGGGSTDTDGDGIPDEHDYAPRNPDVQVRADVQQTDSPTPTPTTTPTRTWTPYPSPTPRPFEQAADPWFEPSSNEFEGEYASTGAGRIKPGEFATISWSSQYVFTLRYVFAVTDGPAIDAYLMVRSEFDWFRENREASIYTEGSVDGAQRGEVDIRLGPGEFVLVFDNTAFGEAVPGRVVEFVYGSEASY